VKHSFAELLGLVVIITHPPSQSRASASPTSTRTPCASWPPTSPLLDPAYVAGIGATVAWGERRDEDRLESLRFTGSAAEAFSRVQPSHPEPVTLDGIGLDLSKR